MDFIVIESKLRIYIKCVDNTSIQPLTEFEVFLYVFWSFLMLNQLRLRSGKLHAI